MDDHTEKMVLVERALEINLLAKLKDMQILLVGNYILQQRAMLLMSFNFSRQSVSNWV
jgi:hypothetical protein